MARRANPAPGGAARRALAAVALIGAGLVASPGPVPAATEPPSSTTFCERVRPGEIGGQVADAGLDEISGLAASPNHEGVLWAAEDSLPTPALSAMDPSGADLGQHAVSNAGIVDWEDLAIGPGPDPERSYLFIGDIGDNTAVRPAVTVYRVPEPRVAPDATGAALGRAEAFPLRYPGGPEDAEALLVDPTSGELVIVTKALSGRSTVLSVEADDLITGSVTTMTEVGEIEVPEPRVTAENATALPGTFVTGADLAPDGATILLRTYRSVLAYPRPEGIGLGEALLGDPCFARQVSEPQGEAIAFSASGDEYTTVSEVQLARAAGRAPGGEGPPLNRFAVTAPDEPLPTAPRGVGEEPGTLPWWIVPLGIAGLVLASVIGLVVLVRRARGRGDEDD